MNPASGAGESRSRFARRRPQLIADRLSGSLAPSCQRILARIRPLGRIAIEEDESLAVATFAGALQLDVTLFVVLAEIQTVDFLLLRDA
jgi:hypothetical protein